ncbi:MAG: GNAT family N-acetyltransferase [Acidimicrobiales bacterium]
MTSDDATHDPAGDVPRYEIVDRADVARFELLRNGELISYADYRQDDRSVVVPHVETVVRHRGHGHAARLMEGLLAQLRRDGRTIVPLCSFAAAHIRADPAHHDLVSPR